MFGHVGTGDNVPGEVFDLISRRLPSVSIVVSEGDCVPHRQKCCARNSAAAH
jgi:hypothetical protein